MAKFLALFILWAIANGRLNDWLSLAGLQPSKIGGWNKPLLMTYE